MKVSKGQSQPEIVAELRLLNSLHGSGWTILIPGSDYDSFEEDEDQGWFLRPPVFFK